MAVVVVVAAVVVVVAMVVTLAVVAAGDGSGSGVGGCGREEGGIPLGRITRSGGRGVEATLPGQMKLRYSVVLHLYCCILCTRTPTLIPVTTRSCFVSGLYEKLCSCLSVARDSQDYTL